MTEMAVRIILLIPILYLLTMYLLWENGPFGVFRKLRNVAGVIEVPTPDGEVKRISSGRYWADVLTCHRCLSPYAAAVVVLFAAVCGWLPISPGILIMALFIIAGANVFIYEIYHDL